jgi:HEAT repeat protein
MNTAPTLGVITTDHHLAIRGWNEWMADATGIPEASVLGRPLIEVVAAERVDFYRELFAEVLERGTARVLAPAFHKYLVPCAPRVASAHFEHMQQRVTVAPLSAEAGAVGVMLTLEDVTDRLDRERTIAAMIQHQPGETHHTEAALASDDWRVRGAAVRHLTRSASLDEVRHLFGTLQRDHHDLNVLNSALRVLIASGRAVVEPLMQLLSDREANLRMHAALALGELHAHEAAPVLVGALDDPDENVRFHAIEALGRIGAAESIDPLSKIAASDNFFLAFAAIDALSKTDDARIAPLMVSLLDQELLRPAVIETLAAIGDEDCVPALAGAVNTPSADIPAIAAALVRIHSRYDDGLGAAGFISEAAARAITSDGHAALAAAAAADSSHRAAVVTVLGWVGAAAIDSLVALVGQPSPLHNAVSDAVTAIGNAAVAPLIKRLEAAAPDARSAAAELLGRLGDQRAVPGLLRALDDADAEVVAAAAGALGAIGAQAAVDPLFALFAHPNAAVRRASIAAVNSIGASGTASRARAAMGSAGAHTRECAVRVAGYFGFSDCVPLVMKALADPSEDVRRAAIEQLPILDGIDAVAELETALTTETARNRAAAAHALRLLDEPRVGTSLQAALQDPDAWVRYYAATSLGEARFGSAAAEDLALLARTDPATHVRIAAITALGAMHGVLAAKVAAELMDDEDDDLAIAAVHVLGGVRRHDAHGWLTRASRSSRPAIQLAAVRALAERPHPDSVEVLSWAAHLSDNPALPGEAIDALRRIAGAADQGGAQRAAVSALRELAAEGTQRRDVIAAIARLPEALVPELASGLSARRVATRIATADALAAMRHPRASGELSRALRDEDAAVRAAAVSGFAKLGTPSVARTIAAMRLNDPDPDVRRRAELACTRHGWGGGPLPRA